MTDKIEIPVPDIGSASKVDVIEILVKPGDHIQVDTPLVTLESDKASMEIPSPSEGIVDSIQVKVGDKVSQGSPILLLKASGSKTEAPEKETLKQEPKEAPKEALKQEPQEEPKTVSAPAPILKELGDSTAIAAGPAVRRLARELGVDLAEIAGSGRKSRITKEDLQQYVKAKLQAQGGGLGLAPMPAIDFSQFGKIEQKPLNKIKRLTGAQVHRSWLSIPQVTQFDEADITDLEAFRKTETEAATKNGYKLTILAFVVKAVCKALSTFPAFNTSLDERAENIVYKQYMNIGIAVETPNGLVVPVIKEANHLSIGEIAAEMARLSKKAREKGLTPADMSGGCFTISSLGGIGGTAFTPIVNAPEVAILGLSRAAMKPVYEGKAFIPRLMLPLSLSYDHRVIDGAEAARFTRYLADLLGDIRRVLL